MHVSATKKLEILDEMSTNDVLSYLIHRHNQVLETLLEANVKPERIARRKALIAALHDVEDTIMGKK